LWRIGLWYRPQIAARKLMKAEVHPDAPGSRKVITALFILVMLMFSKQVYTSSLGSYYTFYLIGKFGISTQAAQLYLFLFLGATAAGTYFGGPLGDRFGRRYVIWFSILGVLPFTLVLPYVGLYVGAVLTVLIGFIIASATPSIIVFAQELMPHRFGLISGIFYGLAFGFGGLGAAVLGQVADHTSMAFVYQLCSFLPAIGLLAVFLPKMPKLAR
jgi:FSR family fosmidomycin resistance protein-like MFS transporter